MKIRFFRSLGFYLFLTLLVFAVFPLIAFQVTSHNRAKQELEKNTENQIRRLTAAAGRMYEERIAKEIDGLAFIREMPSLDKEFLSRYFYQYHDVYYRVSLLDSSGNPHFSLVSNFDPNARFPVPFEERTDLFGIPPSRLPEGESLEIMGTYPVPDGYALRIAGKSGSGYLLTDLRLSVFLSKIEDLLNLQANQQFMAADERGAVIYSRNPEYLNRILEIPSNRFSREKASMTGFSSRHEGLWFGIMTDYQYLLDSINRSIRLNLTLGLGGVLLVFFLAYLVVRPLTSPLSKLVRAADGVAQGNFDLRTDIRHPEEFKVLGERFNRMAAELKALLEEKSRTQNFTAIGKFASYFAHDIKSPLEGTYLIASEIQKNMKSDDLQRKNMNELLKGITRMRDLVNSSLDFSRVNNPRLEYVEINRLISLKADEFKQNFPCRIELNLSPDGNQIRIDPVLFFRILDNLFQNSLEASPEGCVIRMATRQDEHHVYIEIEDSGRGISPAAIEKIFEPFHTSKQKGCGFGLAFVQEAIRKHGGRIAADSYPGKGTKMTLILPLRQAQYEE